mmetsp:Transcript_47697/g.120081  ORF Transcript_47697/g.120081 Transcript_47697/m.120081 type:complete len:202 (+) Transcript_47697:738-1343(+)
MEKAFHVIQLQQYIELVVVFRCLVKLAKDGGDQLVSAPPVVQVGVCKLVCVQLKAGERHAFLVSLWHSDLLQHVIFVNLSCAGCGFQLDDVDLGVAPAMACHFFLLLGLEGAVKCKVSCPTALRVKCVAHLHHDAGGDARRTGLVDAFQNFPQPHRNVGVFSFSEIFKSLFNRRHIQKLLGLRNQGFRHTLPTKSSAYGWS